jgi:hypothetical protein
MESQVIVPYLGGPAMRDISFVGVGGPRQVHAVRVHSVCGNLTNTAAVNLNLLPMTPITVRSSTINAAAIKCPDYIDQQNINFLAAPVLSKPGLATLLEPSQQTQPFTYKFFGKAELPVSFDLNLYDITGDIIDIVLGDYVFVTLTLYASGNLR